jgi:hypothetical protein
MLPDLRFLICGVLFCFLLFAVSGAGVRLPDARTRIGETPEIGRAMMQRSIVEAPAPARYYIATAARHAGEPEARELAGPKAAPTQPEPDPPPDFQNPAVAAEPESAAPDSVPHGLTAEDAEAPIPVLPSAVAHDERTAEAAGPQVAALEPPSPEKPPSFPAQLAADGSESVPRFAKVPLPLPRPAFFDFRRRAHLFHRRRRVVAVVRDPPAQTAPAQSAPGQAAQGAIVQGWQHQSVP